MPRAAPNASVDPKDRTIARLQAELDALRARVAAPDSADDAPRVADGDARYRVLAESIDDVLSVHDLDGTTVYYSASMAEATGLDERTLLDGDVYSLVHPDDHPILLDHAHLLALRGETTTVQLRLRHRDGGYRWFESRVSLLRDDQGFPDKLLVVSRDAEERRRTEVALHASEERYRSLISRAVYGIFRSSTDGHFLEANPALVGMLGYGSVDELLAIDIPSALYIDPADRAAIVARLITEDLDDWVEVRWRRHDGTPIMVRLSARAARAADGRILYYEGIAEDVTSRARHEEMLRRSERMASLGHTLAGVAHELNNPLAAVCGFAQLMLQRRRDRDDRSALETMLHEATRAGRIVKDLLTFARRQDAERHIPLQVNETVSYILSSQQYAMETHGIVRDVHLAADLPYVIGSPSQLEQVLVNLLVNARQALEDGDAARADDRVPTITVRTRQEQDEVVIDIGDNGPGIASDALPRIWDPFFTTKPEGEGTGLGLSVVHGIVTEHGGHIDVESTPSDGTRFTIRLPVVQTRLARISGNSELQRLEAVAVAAEAAPPGERAAHPLDLLIVDDERAILEFLTRYFASRGHAVVATHDGAHALRLAAQSPFDVVVCDLRMPGLDGREVVRRMRAIPGCERTRYVISTGDSVSSNARDAIAGIDAAAVVDKPYEIELLRRAVEGP
jgi:two-component system, NtrC family, sensor kinase